jgi:hypothetical protein
MAPQYIKEDIVQNENHIGKEFKALGTELAKALKQIRSSKEFQDLEKEIGSAVKGVSLKLAKSLKAAKNSKQTANIKKRLKRVAHAGVVDGTAEAKKLRSVTLQGLRKILKNVKKAAK